VWQRGSGGTSVASSFKRNSGEYCPRTGGGLHNQGMTLGRSDNSMSGLGNKEGKEELLRGDEVVGDVRGQVRKGGMVRKSAEIKDQKKKGRLA